MMNFEHTMDIAGIVIVASAFFVAFVYPPTALRRAIKLSCIALARAVEAREPYQLGHSERSAALVVAMAWRSMQFAPWQIWDLEIAALLHMIGKVGVSHATLNSAIRPEGPQLFALREYVLIGAQILNAVPPLRGAADTVAYHREYMDGAGYPYGRYGDGIPFGARLLCVATEYVAMTSPRIYRADGAVMTTNEALEYFKQHAGQTYDPKAVSLLAQVCTTSHRPASSVFVPLDDRIRAVAE